MSQRRLTWGKLIGLGLVVAVLAAGGAGTAGYLIAGSHRRAGYVASCGGRDCLPTLPADAVIEALKGKGFTCAEESSWTCEFESGDAAYTAYLSTADGHLTEMSVRALVRYDRELTPARTEFLTWFAAMPFANDEATVGDIRAWLASRLTGGKDVKATIGGWLYELTASKPRDLNLRIRPEY